MLGCLTCSHENPDDARFCQNCGNPLPRVCHQCGTHNQADAHFCKNCGARLNNSGQSAVQSPEKNKEIEIEPYAAPAGGERRVVTILFADVVDSTMLAEKMDPEDWAAIMNQAFDVLTPVIYRYEGTVTRLMGDALLALFGAPVAHEDEPQRAAHAALELIEVARRFSSELRARHGIEFAIRVGINTGPVVVGSMGGRLFSEYTAMGDAANLAARMQSAAGPMQIFVTQSTYLHLHGTFECEDLGRVAIKGKAEPVQAYSLVRALEHKQHQRGLTGLYSPMVGRDDELARLTTLSNVVRAGLGRAVIIRGEPGIGKSRLVKEWKQFPTIGGAAGQDLQWVEGHCLSYGKGLPYHLVIDLLRSLLGVHDTNDPALVQNALQTASQILGEEPDGPVITYLLHLLSLPIEPQMLAQIEAMDPQAVRQQYVDSLKQLIERRLQETPLVFVLEDLHWADSASVDVLDQLVPLVLETPLLLCCLTRPDRDSPGWRLVQSMRNHLGQGLLEIKLTALSDEDNSRLVSNLLTMRDLPPAIHKLIRERAEGNPFFIEEIIRSLMEQGVLNNHAGQWGISGKIENVEIPGNLQGLLMARIDRLEEQARWVLRVAAVIGRQFSLKVLRAVLLQAGQTDSVRQQNGKPVWESDDTEVGQLGRLESAGLVELTNAAPVLEYRFHHVMIQDAAYDSLLKSERKSLHRTVGEVMEHLSADQLEEQAPRLAEHFWQGGDRDRALRYALMAARREAKIYANDAALEHFNLALQAAADDAPHLYEIYLARGSLHDLIGNLDRARFDFEAALRSARSMGELRAEWEVLKSLGMHWAALDYRKTGQYYQQALELAHRMGDERVLGYSLNRIGNYLINVERPDASLENHHQALDIFQRLEDEAGIAETMDFLGLSYALSGDIRKGVDYLDQALALFERLENLYGQVTSMATRTATATGYQTDTMPSVGLKTDEGVRIAERALQTAEKIGWGSGIAYGCCSISIGWLGMGEFDRALQMANRARATADQMKHRQWEAFSRLAQGLVYAELFAYDRAIEIMQPGLTLALESYSLHWTHALAGSITRAMIGKGDIDQAEQFLDRHFPLDAPARMLSERLCWCTRAELEIEKGNPERALAIAKKMVDEVRNMEDGTVIRRVWLLRARSLLELAQKSRDVEDCRRLLGQAADLTAALLNEAQQLGYAVILWRASVLLAKIFDAAGRQQDAKEQRKNAREYVLELSGKISDRELQQQFLNKSFEIIGG